MASKVHIGAWQVWERGAWQTTSKPIATNAAVSPTTFHIGDTISAIYTYLGDNPETGSLIHWYKNGAQQPYYNNSKSFSVTGARGDAWFFIVRPCDGVQYGNPVQSTSGVMLNNQPTEPMYVEVVPHNPQTNDDLMVVYGGAVDPDGDRVLYSIRWYKNGEEMLSYRDKTRVPYTELSIADVFSVEVSTSDGY